MAVEQRHRFQTASGLSVCARLMNARDSKHLVDLFEHMGPESRYSRFHQSLENVSSERIWREAEQIANASPDKAFGLIAFADLPGRQRAPVGVARLVALDMDEAEAAISVRDDLQGQGIGTELMRRVAKMAQEKGYQRIVATILNDNSAVWTVFRRLPYPMLHRAQDHTSDLVVDLSPSLKAKAPE